MYRNTSFLTHKAYIQSPQWRDKRKRIEKKYPLSRYCFICDCTTYLELHHEGYETVPHERFFIDLFWLCGERCHDCHFTVQTTEEGVMLYDKASLRERRVYLRKRYVLEHLRSSTLLHFFKRYFYRKMY